MADQSIMLSFQCAQCGKDAERSYRGSGVRPTLCGNACKVAASRARDPDRVMGYRAREARLIAIADQSRVRLIVWRNRPKREAAMPPPKLCRGCGAKVARCAQRCEMCRARALKVSVARFKASPAHKKGKRIRKAARRAIERGIEAERFDPLEVLSRDGWCCHLCGCKTPKRLRGTYADNAPELDHIVPLSKGGKHTRLNTACACRKCNGSKGSDIIGQLRLVA